MKKIFSVRLLTLSLLAITLFSKCTPDDMVPPPDLATFAAQSSGAYFVQDDPNSVFRVPVGVSTVSDRDRTINFTVSSPTGAGANQYTIAKSNVVIPAGESVGYIDVKGIFAGYATPRKDTLVFTLTGGDVPAADFNNTYKLAMQKYCNVTLANLGGNYTNTRESEANGTSPYGPYTSTVAVTPITGSTTTANIVFGNFWDSNFNATGTIDWTDPANFKVTIPLQATGLNYAPGQPISVRTSPGQTNTFSSCDPSYTLTVDFIVNNYPSAGSSAYYSQNYKITIRR